MSDGGPTELDYNLGTVGGGGGSPTPPTPTVTLPNDVRLVELVDVTGAQEVDENVLASGWSY